MIHLKRFNENIIGELKEFCETSLAYLLDEGFEISFFRVGISGISEAYTQVNIYRSEFNRDLERLTFNWELVQDHIIPFLQLLEKRYCLNNFDGYNQNRVIEVLSDLPKVYSIEQLVSSRLPTRFPKKIKRIRIKVADKILS